MKRFILFSFLIYVILTPEYKLYAYNEGVKVVVIDAGHGGNDCGAVGKYVLEKNVNLSVALLLGEMITKTCPDVKVLYTRKDDNFVELYNRAKIANENKADLFISIHCNSSKSVGAHGVETFVMGVNKSNQNLEIVKKENAAILLEDNYEANYDGFDPNSAESHIMFAFYQNIHLDQSLKIAKRVQDQIIGNFGLTDRGVKQAGLVVLWASAMPGILVELGFINNPNEENLLKSKESQKKYAKSICDAFCEYKKDHEKGSVPYEIVSNKESEKTIDLNNNTKKEDTLADCYRVQFFISKTCILNNDPKFKGIKDVNNYFHNGLYKYTAGNESCQEDAEKVRKKLIQLGYKDAFIVVFKDGKRADL